MKVSATRARPKLACRYSAARWEGQGQRLSAEPGGPVFATIKQPPHDLRTTLAIPLGEPRQGMALELNGGGLMLRAWSAGRPLVRLYPRKPLHFGAVVIARSGLVLRWLGSERVGTLTVTPDQPLEHLTLKQPLRLKVRCADVGPAPLDYATPKRERALLDLTKAKRGYRLLGGVKIPLAGGPGAPPQGTLLLPHDKREGVLLLARQQRAARVFATFGSYAIDAWVPASAVRGAFFRSMRSPRWPRYYPRRRGRRVRYVSLSRGERWRCAEALEVYLERDGERRRVGRFAAHHTLRLQTGRGLWLRIAPRGIPWLTLAPGADLVVSRAPLSRCTRLEPWRP